MTRQKSAPSRLKNPAYRPAFERLDAALAENTRCTYRDRIDMARIALFGDAAIDVIRQERFSNTNSLKS
jgi:hypothetical protein